MELRFLSVTIYYNSHYRECAAGAKSCFFESGYILSDEGNITPTDIKNREAELPIYKMCTKPSGNNDYHYVREIDIDGNFIEKPNMNGPMFGANYVSSSDSRFPFTYPLPIHDRFEQWN